MTDAIAINDPHALLTAMESAVYSRQHGEALRRAIALVDALASRSSSLDLAQPGYSGHPYLPHAAFCERFAAAWGALLLDDDFDAGKLPVAGLMPNLQVLHLLVHGTAEGTLDACMRALNERVGGNHPPLSLVRLSLMWVPGSRFGLNVFSLHGSIPLIATAQAVATVGALVACTPEVHAAREAAVDFLCDGPASPDDYAPFGHTNDLGSALMRCSYAASDRSHDVKEFLNRVIARQIAQAPSPTQVGRAEARGGKPVMLLPLDSFTSSHAMYRCYGAVLAECRRHFHMVALVKRQTLDDVSCQLFDQVLDADSLESTPGETNYATIIRHALRLRPDLVFYPSVGMRKLTGVLALHRLAPVQVMTLGHPATSRSPVMDYLVSEEQWVVDPVAYSETVVNVPRGTLRFSLPPRTADARCTSGDHDVVRVAVPSVCQKWTLPFIEALRDASNLAGGNVEFHLFSGEQGFGYAAAVNAAQRTLRNVVVHPSLGYDAYCAALARCDLQAGTFPFGGTNSIIDSLVHGLPVLCMAPRDARGAQDADFIERAGLPGWLVARDVADYVATLARLIGNRVLREELRGILADRRRVESVFLAQGKPEVFAEALFGLLSGGNAGQ